MRIPLLLVPAIAMVTTAHAAPLATVSGFTGKFAWAKLAHVPAASIASLAHAKAIQVKVSFPHAVKLKKDAGGHVWLTMILADQGSDWKWHQTSKSGAVPVKGDTVAAGTYTVKIPLDGIPATVLKGKQQTLNLGPAASGTSSPAQFTVLDIRGA